MENANLILEYIRVLFSWPTIVLICFILFVSLYKGEIRALLDRIKKIYGIDLTQKEQEEVPAAQQPENKIANSLEEGGITLTTEQLQNLESEFNRLSEKTNQQDAVINDKDQLIQYAIGRAELFEFAYLEKILVINTRLALLWFYAQPSHSSTRENYMFAFTLPEQIPNHQAEKEAIINALIVYELLDNNSNPALFTVTQKGERFLKELKLIAQ